MLWISLAIIVVMGGATLWLRDATFIKWKPTVLYWAFAAVLLGAEFAVRAEPDPRDDGDSSSRCPTPVWARLNLSWAAFFVVMGAINLYVAYRFSESTWVNFKLFGGIGLMVVFVLVQGMYLSRYVHTDESAGTEDGK